MYHIKKGYIDICPYLGTGTGYGSGVRFSGTVFGLRFWGTLGQSRPYERIPTYKVLRYGFGIRCGTVVRFCGMVWYGRTWRLGGGYKHIGDILGTYGTYYWDTELTVCHLADLLGQHLAHLRKWLTALT